MSTAVRYALSDFVTGSPILDLPVMEGASWGAQLNEPDSLTCKVDMRDRVVRALDLASSSASKKTVLSARTEEDVVLAWGIISERKWNETDRTLELNAFGLWQWLNGTIIGPASALTEAIVNPDGSPNAALDTAYAGYSFGTIGKKLVEQRLAWPGSPTITLPADEIGTRERNEYYFVALKSVGEALTELADVQNGPDFAFDATRAPDGLTLAYSMRHGSEAEPRLGLHAGSWGLGAGSPISGFKYREDGSDFATAAWSIAGRSGDRVVASRDVDVSLVDDAGYPSVDYVDTSHSDVSRQATLDGYNAQNLAYAGRMQRDLTFNVRGDAALRLGQYRPGDTVTVTVPSGHLFIREPELTIRVLGISGDETGETIKIDSVVLA